MELWASIRFTHRQSLQTVKFNNTENVSQIVILSSMWRRNNKQCYIMLFNREWFLVLAAVIYVLILFNDTSGGACSEVCLFSHCKSVFAFPYSLAKLQAYELPRLLYYLFFIILWASSCTWHVATWKLIQQCAVSEAVLPLVEMSTTLEDRKVSQEVLILGFL